MPPDAPLSPDPRAARFARADYAMDALSLARRLLGQRLVRVINGRRRSGLIVETEAYLGERDRACHSFAGRRTPRVEPMYAHAGTSYVYFTYGMHHCFNVVAGELGEPVAVLIRAIEPVEGVRAMLASRGGGARTPGVEKLCAGPARLCMSLSLDRRHSGLDMTSAPDLFIEHAPPVPPRRIGSSARIGLGNAGVWTRRRLRFFLKASPYLSR